MANKPTEIEGIDPLTNGKRAFGEDVQGKSIFNENETVKHAPKPKSNVITEKPGEQLADPNEITGTDEL